MLTGSKKDVQERSGRSTLDTLRSRVSWNLVLAGYSGPAQVI